MKDKLKKVIVFLLAILMIFAFSPFLFMSPDSGRQAAPEENQNRQQNTSVTSTVSTSTVN